MVLVAEMGNIIHQSLEKTEVSNLGRWVVFLLLEGGKTESFIYCIYLSTPLQLLRA